jgi:hypothetical protein
MSIKMTRSHFELIADVVAGTDMDNINRANIAMNFANVLHRTNSAFDEKKFLKACGVTDSNNDIVVCEWADKD